LHAVLTTQVQLPGQVRPVTCRCDDDQFEVGEAGGGGCGSGCGNKRKPEPSAG
jgi:hypothetical protein